MKQIDINHNIKKIYIIYETDTQALVDMIIQTLANDFDNIRDYLIILPSRNRFIDQFPEEIISYLK